MKNVTRCALAAACFLVVSPSVIAAMFSPRADREMVRLSDAIVVGQALSSHAQLNAKGGIETVTVLSVDEAIKGELPDTIDIVEPGGTFGMRTLSIPGVPRFADGQRVLLFLSRTGVDRWSVTDLMLGCFDFDADLSGHRVVVRSRDDESGLDSDGGLHRSERRSEEAFLNFLRAESHGGPARGDYFIPAQPLESMLPTTKRVSTFATYTGSSYTYDTQNCPQQPAGPPCGAGTGSRWNVFPGTAVVLWTEPGTAANAIAAVQAAVNTWSLASGVNYTWAVDPCTPSCKTNGLVGAPDGANSVLFERDLKSEIGIDPISCSSSGWSGTLGIGGISSAPSTYTFNGEQFTATTEGDVEMNKGVVGCPAIAGNLFTNGDLTTDVTHEIGHTLGFRHSDQTRANNPSIPCSGTSLECSASAVMKATIPTGLNGGLTTFDRDAVQTLYPCTAPSIGTQPANATISSGQSTTLSVSVSVSSVVTYQWYQGTSGNTTTPISNATSSSVNVSPTTTTSYWVRITGCGTSVDSAAATVTVSACPTPVISIAPGACVGSTQNTATVTPVSGGTYSWAVTNGTITNGQGTTTITFQPTAAGSVNVSVTVTSTGCSSTPSAVVTATTCANSGDVNGNGAVNAADVFYLINTLFAGGPPVAGGTGDANNDGVVNAGDIIYLIRYLFAGGGAPH